MARSITTCTGAVITIGDKVKTASGRIIRVEGAAIGKRFFNAETCEVVDPSTPTTAEATAALGQKPIGGGQDSGDSDCVVWGS